MAKLPSGADKFWELGKCIKQPKLPVTTGARQNLELLLEIRHEIEHRSTDRIDDALGPSLQACRVNFNDAIRGWFGEQFGLERRLPIALQFVTFDPAQAAGLKASPSLPKAIAATMDAFNAKMSEGELKDPAFAYRVAFVPIVGSKASKSDLAFNFIRPDSDMAKEVNSVLLKEADKKRHTATQIVDASVPKAGPASRCRTTPLFGRNWMRRTQAKASASRVITKTPGFGLIVGWLAFERIAKRTQAAMWRGTA